MGKGEHEESHTYSSVYIVGDLEKPKGFMNADVAVNKVRPKVNNSMSRAREFSATEPAVSEDHAQALLRLKERREREPLLYCKIVTRWPLQSFCK